MMITEFVDNSNFLSTVKSAFYYYDDKWNFPYGDDIGFYIIENKINQKLDDKIKQKITKMESYLNDNNINYEDGSRFFHKIWIELD
jgi:hypothetical protein